MSVSIMRLFLSVGLTASLLAACAGGPIHGRFSPPNQTPASVVLKYESSFLGGSGKLWMTLPTGETFKGNYRLVPHDPKRQMLANLTGDRGSTMVCRFTLNEPGIGPDGGGTVQCQLSTGGLYDATF